MSEFCTTSFLEFREGNSSGPLIGRFCGGLFPSTVESTEGPIYIRIRHKMEQEWNDENEKGDKNIIINTQGGGSKKIARIELKYSKGEFIF